MQLNNYGANFDNDLSKMFFDNKQQVKKQTRPFMSSTTTDRPVVVTPAGPSAQIVKMQNYGYDNGIIS